MKYLLMVIILFVTPIYSQTKKQVSKFEYLVIAIKDESASFNNPNPYKDDEVAMAVLLDPITGDKNHPVKNRYGSDPEFKQDVYLESLRQEMVLDKLGSQGWQLINVVGNLNGDKIFYFQREKL